MRMLMIREFVELAKSHTASKWKAQDPVWRLFMSIPIVHDIKHYAKFYSLEIYVETKLLTCWRINND